MYRRLRMPTIWREMDQLQREMDRLLNVSSNRPISRSAGFPAVNIWTSEDGQVITSELPGFDPEDIDINVSADKLVISGERKAEPEFENASYHRKERSFGKFQRTLQLPFMIDTNKVDAKFNDGILTVALQRAEADKPKKIAIKSK